MFNHINAEVYRFFKKLSVKIIFFLGIIATVDSYFLTSINSHLPKDAFNTELINSFLSLMILSGLIISFSALMLVYKKNDILRIITSYGLDRTKFYISDLLAISTLIFIYFIFQFLPLFIMVL